MKAIGVRQLRQRASEYLRQAEAGRSFEITSRGRTVALLVPARHGNRRERLIAAGRLEPADGDLLDLGAPVRAAAGTEPASILLKHARDAER